MRGKSHVCMGWCNYSDSQFSIQKRTKRRKGMKDMRMIPQRLVDVLQIVYSGLENRSLNWAVVGSLGLALRGASIEPQDIDIMTDKVGAYEIERIFSDSVTSPVSLKSSSMIQSHFGALSIDGVKIEIMGDFQIRLENGTWQEPPNLALLKETEHIGEMSVPVLPLAWEHDSYMKLGRKDRAESAMELIRNRVHEKPP